MFADPFYHQTTKRVLTAFGVMFDNINIIREDENTGEVNRMKIPLNYHNKKAWHRILREHSDGDEKLVSMQAYFPRMSFYVNDIQPNREIQTQSRVIRKNDEDGNFKTFSLRTPYRMNFELGIYTKKQEDMYRILEQILPYFTPSLAVSIKSSRTLTDFMVDDFVLNLDSVVSDEELELQFDSGYNLQIHTRILNFYADVYFYGPELSANGIIKTATTTFYNGVNGKPMSRVEVQVDPIDAEISSYGISCGSWDLDLDFNFNTYGILEG